MIRTECRDIIISNYEEAVWLLKLHSLKNGFVVRMQQGDGRIIMFLVYFIATSLGAAVLSILFILYLSRKDVFLRYMIATLFSCLVMLAVDAVVFQFYRMNGVDMLWPTLMFDISFYVFCFFWILTMGSVNGDRSIIPPKVLMPVFIVFFASYEIMLGTGHITIAIVSLLAFEVVLFANGIYFMICGVRSRNRQSGRMVLIAAGAGMAAYAAWLIYQDYNAHMKLISGQLETWPHDFLVLFAIVFEVTVLAYFFFADPMNLKKKNKVNHAGLVNAEQYNLTEREKEVAGLIWKGLSNQQIADRTFIAETTVKKHVSNMFRKTGATNRYDLIAKLEGKE